MKLMYITRFVMMMLFVLAGSAHAGDKKPIVCSNTYALCSAAKCQPIPGYSDKTLCTCSIWKGKNYGYSSCETRKEKQNQNGQKAIVSTFSLGGGHYKNMTCSAGTPWANCLDHPCLVDDKSADSRHAVCTCDIVRKERFVTFAGECDESKCSSAIWSGATIQGNQELMAVVEKQTDIKTEQTICQTI